MAGESVTTPNPEIKVPEAVLEKAYAAQRTNPYLNKYEVEELLTAALEQLVEEVLGEETLAKVSEVLWPNSPVPAQTKHNGARIALEKALREVHVLGGSGD